MSISSKHGGGSIRTVPMQVLCLGMPRTGTTSMYAAMEILGYRCYDGYATFHLVDDCKIWSAALDAKYHQRGKPFTRREWDALLGNYAATTDIPGVIFAEELIAAYPEAKVVLVEREIESWYRSMQKSIFIESWNRAYRILAFLDPQVAGPVLGMWLRIGQDPKSFYRAGSRREMEENARLVYRDHCALVRRVTPRERLFEFRLVDGWEPLCKFLGKEVPDVPFPKLNEGEALKGFMDEFRRKSMMNVMRNVTVAIGLAAAAWYALSFGGPRILSDL